MGKVTPHQPSRSRRSGVRIPAAAGQRSSFLARLRKYAGFFALAFAAALWSGLIEYRESNKVTHAGSFTVVDGDSLRSRGREYRLKGIDAPELRQTCANARGSNYACGQEAKAALKRIADGGRIACDPQGIDRYGRTLVYCRADGADVNGRMVELGWAVSYGNISYMLSEYEARKEDRGIWQGQFEYPADWRSRRNTNTLGGMVEGDAPD